MVVQYIKLDLIKNKNIYPSSKLFSFRTNTNFHILFNVY